MQRQNNIIRFAPYLFVGVYLALFLNQTHADNLECEQLGRKLSLCYGSNFRPHGIENFTKIIDESNNFFFGRFSNIESGSILFDKIKLICDQKNQIWYLMNDNQKILSLTTQELNKKFIFIVNNQKYFIIIDVFRYPINENYYKSELVNTVDLRVGRI